MAGDDHSLGAPASASVRPGALSELLEELAAAPPSSDAGAWDDGLRAGVVIGRFELVREIGRGGFGVVWEAKDRELGRHVAFKAVRAGNRRDMREERLLREAEAAARLSHPNIVTLYDVGRSEHGPYLVLELLQGETLAARVSKGALAPDEAIQVAIEIARALAHAHSHGVIHRDLKPENVFLCDDGHVKVLDLGLAHAFGWRRVDGGTSGYMAPEQVEGSPEDERTDVWALGAILFELLMGQRAFPRGNRAAGVPALDVRGIPALGDVVASMLAVRPLDRPRQGGEVLEALSAIQRELQFVPRSNLGRVRARRRPGIRWTTLVLGSMVVSTMTLAAYHFGRRVPAPNPDARVTVAVADVVNETGERELEVLSRLLVTSLEQSRRLKVMTQAQVLDLAIRAGRTNVTRVDETVGREVGRAHGVRALLLPAVHRLGATYAVEMRAIDPGTDQHLFTVSDRTTSKEGLLAVLDALSARARRALGEDPSTVEAERVGLAEAMTRSMEAYQHYVTGLEAWGRDGARAVGLRELLESTRLDPLFAAAHAELAQLYEVYGRPDLAAPHWRIALENVDRMPEKERTVLRLLRAYRTPSPEHWSRQEASRLAAEIVARFPDDKWALASAASAHQWLGEPERRDAALRRALELDPGFYAVAAGLAFFEPNHRPADALEVARRAAATRRTPANLAILASALRASGADAEALATAREALRGDGRQSSLVLGSVCGTLYELGSASECVPLWEWMASSGMNEHERDFAEFQIVKSLALQGRMHEALRRLRSVDEARRGSPYELLHILSIGRSRDDAAAAIEQVRRIPDPSWRRVYLAFYGKDEEAARLTSQIQSKGLDLTERIYGFTVLARDGKFAEAAERMRAIEEELHLVGNTMGLFTASLQRADVLLEAGRTAEAAEAWPIEPPCRCVWPPEHAANYPRLALVRARAMEKLGRFADAIRELDGILAFWKDADTDLPLLVEAKAMRKRLSSALHVVVPNGAPEARSR